MTLDAAGTILSVEQCDRVDSHYGTEFYSGILIPGMVNAHTHLELSYLRGMIPAGGGFVAFADGLGRVRRSFSAEDQRAAADFHDARMWAEGVSAVGDISNGDITFGVKKRSAIHYHTFLELYGLNTHASSLLPLAEAAREAGIAASVTPHSIYSLNEGAFGEAVGAAANTPLSVHFMESPAEQELFDGRGEMSQWYAGRGFQTDFTAKYAGPADRIIANIPTDRKVMLIHNTCARDEDIERLQAHFGDNLTWVLCPRSNRYINGLFPPVDALRRHGCRIAVGTDSLASNTSLSLVEELKMFGDVPLEEALRWATLSGAEALGVDDRCGSLEAGKRPGLVLLEGIDWERMAMLPDARTRRLV